MKYLVPVVLTVLALLLFQPFNISANKEVIKDPGYTPKEGFVPDAETAIKIAEAIWLPIYGKEIYNCKPFVAKLSKDKSLECIWNSSERYFRGNSVCRNSKKGLPSTTSHSRRIVLN